MTMHRYHPDETRPEDSGKILYDDCERCAEHAERPFMSLDNEHLGSLLTLWRRQQDEIPLHLSQNERIAIEKIGEGMQVHRRLNEMEEAGSWY